MSFKRPGFKRLLLIALVLYAGFWVYKTKTTQLPEKPDVVQFMPYNYEKSGKKYPLIVFSHGFMGCPKQSVYLVQALTKKGYIVLAPRHRDATCGNDDNNKFLMSVTNLPASQKNEVSFMKPELWTEETEKDRLSDIRYALDMAMDEKDLGQYVDKDHIGLMGHSLGGYTVLGLAGAQKSWKDDRVKAVLALTPYVAPYLTKGNLRDISVPVMYQSGSTDWLAPAWLVSAAYQSTPGNKYYVEFNDTGHLAWMDLGSKKYRAQIAGYTTAFFDQYLKDQKSALLTAGKTDDGITFQSQEK